MARYLNFADCSVNEFACLHLVESGNYEEDILNDYGNHAGLELPHDFLLHSLVTVPEKRGNFCSKLCPTATAVSLLCP